MLPISLRYKNWGIKQTLEKGYEITERKREKGEDVAKERVGKGL